MRRFLFLSVTLLFASTPPLQGQVYAPADLLHHTLSWAWQQDYSSLTEGHDLTAGPHCGFFDRSTDTGAQQADAVVGGKVYYQRLLPKGIYWGLRSHYLRGSLSGEGVSKLGKTYPIKSRYHEYDLAGRLGYTWDPKFCQGLLVTPFATQGYLHSSNDFQKPSTVVETVRYYYQGIGLCLQSPQIDHFRLGLDFEAVFTFEAESKIERDKKFGNLIRLIEDSWHYSLAAPISYAWWGSESDWRLRVTPGYQYRLLGGRENFPYNFHETTVHLMSLDLEIRTEF